jgi:hypothetical protein
MRQSPFLDDPRDMMRHHIARVVASPIEEVRAINLRAAEHHAALAKASGLDIVPNSKPVDHVPRGFGAMLAWMRRSWKRLGRWPSKALP